MRGPVTSDGPAIGPLNKADPGSVNPALLAGGVDSRREPRGPRKVRQEGSSIELLTAIRTTRTIVMPLLDFCIAPKAGLVPLIGRRQEDIGSERCEANCYARQSMPPIAWSA